MSSINKPGADVSRAVLSAKLASGAKVTEKNLNKNNPNQAVDYLVSGVDKAKESVNKITKVANSKIEVIEQNQSASRIRLEDLEQAIKLSSKLKLNINYDSQKAKVAHDLNNDKAKLLLE